MPSMQVGDWVQAVEEIAEEDFMGEGTFIHAREGGIGHILDLTDDPESVNVYFERTGTVSVCHVSEIKRLGDADVGRFFFL